jgi:hypothetical protein
MSSIETDGQKISFSIGPQQNCTLNNQTSGASTIIINTAAGSRTTHILPPGSNVEIFAGDEILNIEGYSFTPYFEKLEPVV